MTEHPSPENDPLERMLAEPPALDEGFTESVLARLPPKRRPVPRTLLLLVAAGLGTLTAVLSPGLRQVSKLMHEVSLAKLSLGTVPAVLVFVCLVVVLVGSGAQVASNE